MKQIGIDLGSSFIKYAVFDMEHRCVLLKNKRASVPRTNSSNGKFEISAKAIVELTKEIIDEILAVHGDVEGVIFSTQMHGFVFQEETETNPVYVSWQDLRSLNIQPGSDKTWLDNLKREFPESIMKKTGVHIKTALALCNLYILLREKGITHPTGSFYTLGSFVISQLTGNNCCHITNAAPSGMLDIHANDWSNEIIGKAGFAGIKFPTVISGFEPCGTYRHGTKTLNIYADYGDQQATILGCNPRINDLIINIGTAAQISQLVDTIVPNGYEVRPFFENTFLNTITNLPGGRNFETYLDFIEDVGKTFFGHETARKDLWKVLDSNQSWKSNGLVMNNNFYDQKDGSAQYGSINNITPENFRSTFLSAAAYEGIARVYSQCYQSLTKETQKPERVLLSGGKLSGQPMMVKTISGFFDIPVVTAQGSDNVFNGLYKILQVSCGMRKNLTDTEDLISDQENL